MGRKRKHAYKKTVPKKHTIVNGNEEPSVNKMNFVDHNSKQNSGSDDSNDAGFGKSDSDTESESSSSSSSTSSGIAGSFHVESNSSSDELEIDRGVEKSAKKRGRPPKKVKVSKKATNVRTKSSKGLSSSSWKGKQSEKLHLDPRYNKQELKASYAVIKKVMEMDEAVPFSSPVDPVSQGMTDYFNVIDTPMDFGTICSNLQNGVKYLNAEDVFKDVQYIWKNCLKCNKKGDYIVYLMKRVKKKLMKCWAAAGLQSEILQKTSGHSQLVPLKDHTMRCSKHDAVSTVHHISGNLYQMQQDNFGTILPLSQVPLSSSSRTYQFHQPQPQPQPSTTKPPQISKLKACTDSNYAAGNFSQMQQDNFGTIPPQFQVPLSSYSQPYQSHQSQPQPSIKEAPQLSQLQASTDSNYAGHSHLPPLMECNMKHTNYTTKSSVAPVMSLPTHSKQPQPQLSSCYLCQSQQRTCQPQPSQSHSGADIDDTGKSCLALPNTSRTGRRDEQRSSADLGDVIPLVSSHSLPHQPLENHNDPGKSPSCTKKTKKRSRGRGPTLCREMWNMPNGERIVVPVNMLGQPVGPEASKLSTFLGTIARNGEMAPLTFTNWCSMPNENKEHIWQFVQTKFEIDPVCKTWVLKSLASKWRNWKAKLKADHYYPHKTDEERLKDLNERVLPDQWPILVAYWKSEEVQLRCATNKANRANQKSTHVAGSKSFARIREEERVKRPDGKEPTRTELYIKTHTRKNGQPMNEMAAEIILKLHEQETQKQQTSHGSNDWDDAFVQVMGEEKGGHVRMYGLGPTPSDLCGGPKLGRIELMRMVSEAKRSGDEKVSEMLNKMEAMEQKYASMEAQIARMTSNMQRFLDKMGEPSEALHKKQTQEHSSSSIYAVPSNEVG